jgi:hypothetical protein
MLLMQEVKQKKYHSDISVAHLFHISGQPKTGTTIRVTQRRD